MVGEVELLLVQHLHPCLLARQDPCLSAASACYQNASVLSTQHLAAQLAQSARNEVNVFIKPQLSHAGITPPPYYCVESVGTVSH